MSPSPIWPAAQGLATHIVLYDALSTGNRPTSLAVSVSTLREVWDGSDPP